MPHRLLPYLLALAAALLSACASNGGSSVTSSSALATVSLIAAGANHSVALAPAGAASGVASLWGDNSWGQIGDGTSDFCLAGIADLTFAKKSLLRHTRERALPHLAFDSFLDAKSMLAHLTGIADQPSGIARTA